VKITIHNLVENLLCNCVESI